MIFTMQIHLLIFQTSIVEQFSYLPLDYYLNTYYGGPSFLGSFYNLCWVQSGP